MCKRCEQIVREYIGNAERMRNTAMNRGAFLAFIYYQGICDGLAQVGLELEKDKTNSTRDVA